MRILVVGGAGYIGSHVSYAFVDRGDEVAILDNFSSGIRNNCPRNARIIECDIMDRQRLDAILSDGWDAVVHLAALKAAGESMENPGDYALNNISGTINLLNSMLGAKSPLLLFSSSAAIFGDPVRLPIDENHPKQPRNFYGFTKLEIENLLDWYADLKAFRWVSLRYFNAAGYDKRITEPEKDPQNLLPILMEAAAGMRDDVTIYGHDYDTSDGTCVRDYIHVSDLADAHVLGIEYLVRGGSNVKVNLGSESGISVAHMVREAIRITGVKFPYSVGQRRPGDPAILIASSTLAKRLFGWKTRQSSAEALIGSTWRVYKDRKRKDHASRQTGPNIRSLTPGGFKSKSLRDEKRNQF